MDLLFGNLIHHWIDRIPPSVKIGEDLCNFPRPTAMNFIIAPFMVRVEFELRENAGRIKNRGERKVKGRNRDREEKM